MPTATPNYLPQGERLLEGTITSGQLSAAATSCEVSNPPSADKLPTYFEFEPDNVDNRETVRVTDVSGNTITFVRGVYNSGVGTIHASNSAYKQKFTEKHIEAIVDSIQDGWLKEDVSLSLTRDSDTQFTITGIDHTAYYTAGRLLRFNGSDATVSVVASSSLSGSDTEVTLDSAYAIPGTLTTVEVGIFARGASAEIVFKGTAQTISGVKTFSSSPVVPTPTTDLQAATKAYVDDNAGAGGKYVFIIPGTAVAGTDVAGTWFAPEALTIDTIDLYADVAGDTGSTIVDVNIDGTTAFTTQGNRPTLATTATVDTGNVPDVTSVTANQKITIDTDQVTTTPQTDLYVVIKYS